MAKISVCQHQSGSKKPRVIWVCQVLKYDPCLFLCCWISSHFSASMKIGPLAYKILSCFLSLGCMSVPKPDLGTDPEMLLHYRHLFKFLYCVYSFSFTVWISLLASFLIFCYTSSCWKPEIVKGCHSVVKNVKKFLSSIKLVDLESNAWEFKDWCKKQQITGWKAWPVGILSG